VSVPWVGGTVEAVLADLNHSYRCSPSHDDGIVYAAAIGMITGLANGYTPGRSIEQNMTDIRTVCAAVHLFQDEATR
jgi:hypothetical protein